MTDVWCFFRRQRREASSRYRRTFGDDKGLTVGRAPLRNDRSGSRGNDAATARSPRSPDAILHVARCCVDACYRPAGCVTQRRNMSSAWKIRLAWNGPGAQRLRPAGGSVAQRCGATRFRIAVTVYHAPAVRATVMIVDHDRAALAAMMEVL